MIVPAMRAMRPLPQRSIKVRWKNALTPLIWEHVNPYGRYELDMRTRIAALT